MAPITPPSIPSVPASGGELYSSLMQRSSPEFDRSAIHGQNGKIDWSKFSGAMKKFTPIKEESMGHITSSMHHFVRGVSEYTENLSRSGEEKQLNGIFKKIKLS